MSKTADCKYRIQKAYELCLEVPGKNLAFHDVLWPEIAKCLEAALEEGKAIGREEGEKEKV